VELNAIEKALTVLMSFTSGNHSRGTVELAHKLGMHKATVSRVLKTLQKHGFLDQDPQSRLYSLGPAVASLSQALSRSLEGHIVAIAQPYLDDLRGKANETVHLEVTAGGHTYLAYAARGPQPLSVSATVGERTWPNIHAGAKAITAFAPPKRMERLLAGELPRGTRRSITDPELLMAQYKQIRQTGIAYDRGEFDDHIHAIGAPVFNFESRAVGAVVIIGPSFRMEQNGDEGELIQNLKETAAAISARLMSTRGDSGG
jgi:IclR family KDG regulon transcriptional repressor